MNVCPDLGPNCLQRLSADESLHQQGKRTFTHCMLGNFDFFCPDLGPNCLQRLSADESIHQQGKRTLSHCILGNFDFNYCL